MADLIVISFDPGLDVFSSEKNRSEHDRFGLRVLLGALAGAHPFGEQTPERVATRTNFDRFFAGATTPTTMRKLGRVSFIDAADHSSPEDGIPTKEPNLDDILGTLAREQAQNPLLLIYPFEATWAAVKKSITALYGASPYRLHYERRKPPTEKGMKWTITDGPNPVIL